MTLAGARTLADARTLIGLKDGRRKAVVEDDGALLLPEGRVSFHLDGNPLGAAGPVAQKLWHGFLPAVISTDVQGDLAVGLLAFTARTPWGPAEFVRVRLRRERGSGGPAVFAAELRGEGAATGEVALLLRDGESVRLAALPCGGGGGWSAEGGAGEARVTLTIELSPRDPVERWLVFPWEAFPTDAGGLAGLDGEEALESMSQEWEALLTKGAKLELPDDEFQHAAKAAIAQLLMLRNRDADGCWPVAGPAARRGLDLAGGVAQVVALDRLGYAEEARGCLDTLLAGQRPDGRFESVAGAWDGNGRAAWALMEHFWLTRDLAWLRRAAPALLASCRWIVEARKTPGGLLPSAPGGARGPAAEVTANGWALHACRLGLEAAAYLGEDAAWLESEADEFREAVSGAAAAALAAANGGGMPVGGVVHPSEVFDRADPRLGEYLDRVLDAAVDGLPRRPRGPGAAAEPAEAADLGGALLRNERCDEACALLGAMLGNATATFAWPATIETAGGRVRGGQMPSGAAAAAFLLLLRNLLAREDASTLHVFPGVPRPWTGSGQRIDFKRLPTAFGPLEASLATEGGETLVGIVLHAGREPERVVVHLRFPEPRVVTKCALHGICADERIDGDRLVIEKPRGVLFVTLTHERAPVAAPA